MYQTRIDQAFSLSSGSACLQHHYKIFYDGNINESYYPTQDEYNKKLEDLKTEFNNFYNTHHDVKSNIHVWSNYPITQTVYKKLNETNWIYQQQSTENSQKYHVSYEYYYNTISGNMLEAYQVYIGIVFIQILPYYIYDATGQVDLFLTQTDDKYFFDDEKYIVTDITYQISANNSSFYSNQTQSQYNLRDIYNSTWLDQILPFDYNTFADISSDYMLISSYINDCYQDHQEIMPDISRFNYSNVLLENKENLTKRGLNITDKILNYNHYIMPIPYGIKILELTGKSRVEFEYDEIENLIYQFRLMSRTREYHDLSCQTWINTVYAGIYDKNFKETIETFSKKSSFLIILINGKGYQYKNFESVCLKRETIFNDIDLNNICRDIDTLKNALFLIDSDFSAGMAYQNHSSELIPPTNIILNDLNKNIIMFFSSSTSNTSPYIPKQNHHYTEQLKELFIHYYDNIIDYTDTSYNAIISSFNKDIHDYRNAASLKLLNNYKTIYNKYINDDTLSYNLFNNDFIVNTKNIHDSLINDLSNNSGNKFLLTYNSPNFSKTKNNANLLNLMLSFLSNPYCNNNSMTEKYKNVYNITLLNKHDFINQYTELTINFLMYREFYYNKENQDSLYEYLKIHVNETTTFYDLVFNILHGKFYKNFFNDYYNMSDADKINHKLFFKQFLNDIGHFLIDSEILYQSLKETSNASIIDDETVYCFAPSMIMYSGTSDFFNNVNIFSF